MMVLPAPESHYFWIEQKTKAILTRNARVIEVVDSMRKVVGMAAFDLWTNTGVTIHLAIDKPMALRKLIEFSIKYIFEQCNKSHILAYILGDNKKSTKLATHFGFKEEARIKQGWSKDVDMVIYKLNRSEGRC